MKDEPLCQHRCFSALRSRLPLSLPWGAREIHCHLFYCFQGHKITTMSTTNVSLFWSNPKEESPLSPSGSIAPVDSHRSSSREVAQSQSAPLSFSSLLAPTEGGSEFRIVHRGLGYFGVNSEEGGVQKKKTQAGELRQEQAKSLGVKREKCSSCHKREVRV